MLKEGTVFALGEVGERSLKTIEKDFVAHFVYCLREMITDKHKEALRLKGNTEAVTFLDTVFTAAATANFLEFCQTYGRILTYNTKNIVAETPLYNSVKLGKNLKETFAQFCGLTPVNDEGLSERSANYEYIDGCETTFKLEGEELIAWTLPYFDKFFGLGNFPVMTIHVVRIGNLDHCFYTLSR